MPVIIVGNEKNFTALRSRIFSGRVPTAAAQEVSDAIAAANPHVDLNKLEPGTVLTVPDLPHVKVAGDLSLDDTTKQVLAGIAQSGADALADIVAAAKSADRDAAAERKQLDSDPVVDRPRRRGGAEQGPRRRRQGGAEGGRRRGEGLQGPRDGAPAGE